MPSEQLGDAISLVKTGYKEQAREILFQIILDDPHNETAWIWLVETMPNDAERVTTLEQCLKYNPESKMAQKGLQIFRSHLAASNPETTASQPINAPQPVLQPEITPAPVIPATEKPDENTSSQTTPVQPGNSLPIEQLVESELVPVKIENNSQTEAVTEQPNPVTQPRKKKAPGKSSRLLLILFMIIIVLLIFNGSVRLCDNFRKIFGNHRCCKRSCTKPDCPISNKCFPIKPCADC